MITSREFVLMLLTAIVVYVGMLYIQGGTLQVPTMLQHWSNNNGSHTRRVTPSNPQPLVRIRDHLNTTRALEHRSSNNGSDTRRVTPSNPQLKSRIGDHLNMTRTLDHSGPDKNGSATSGSTLSIAQLFHMIRDHFNMTRIYQIRDITREYFAPERHIIYFKDIDTFLEKCNPGKFTLLNTSEENPAPCNVTHSPVTHYRTCAVIGNGGILLNSSCGAEIDAHEFVIRNNLPPTLPYAKDVGKKTNLTTINHSKLRMVGSALGPRKKDARKAMLAHLRESPGMIFSYSLSVVGSRAHGILKGVDRVLKENKIPVVLAFAHQSNMGSKGLYRKLAGKRWALPSTGLNTFALASTFCDRISMYGYYPLPTYQGRNVSYHYYDEGGYGRWHKMEQEFAMFQDFHNQGILRHVIGKCDSD